MRIYLGEVQLQYIAAVGNWNVVATHAPTFRLEQLRITRTPDVVRDLVHLTASGIRISRPHQTSTIGVFIFTGVDTNQGLPQARGRVSGSGRARTQEKH